MSKPLEPGCLAQVIVTAESPENMMRIVRCVEELPRTFEFMGEVIEAPPGSFGICRLWMVEAVGSPLVFRMFGLPRQVNRRPFCGARLRRLPDDIPPDEVRDLYAPTPLLEEPVSPRKVIPIARGD